MGEQVVKWPIIRSKRSETTEIRGAKRVPNFVDVFRLDGCEMKNVLLWQAKKERTKNGKKVWNLKFLSRRYRWCRSTFSFFRLFYFFLSRQIKVSFSTPVWAIFMLETENTTEKMRKSSFFFGSSETSRLSFQLTSALLVRPREIHSSMCLLLSSTSRERGDETERIFIIITTWKMMVKVDFFAFLPFSHLLISSLRKFKLGRICFVHIVQHIPTVLVTQFVSIIRS